MHIAFIVPGFPLNGGTKRIVRLGNELHDIGHKVTFISKKDGKPTWINNKVPIQYGVTEIPGTDFYVLYECACPETAAKIAKWEGQKILLVLSAKYQKTEWVDNNICNQSYYKICTTEWLRDYCNSKGERERTSQTVLLTGVDDCFKRVQRWEHTGIIVGYCNSSNRHYRTDLIKQVANIVCPRSVQYINYHHEGNRSPEEIADIYAGCDIWVCAHDIDGLGMPSLEAMATGCCLVTTDTQGNRFYARHGETALVSNPGEVVGLKKNLVIAVTNKELRERLTKAGKEYACSLNWTDHAIRLETILKSIRKPYISVICTTYKMKDLVNEWLGHIGECLPACSEVIVSDGGSDQDTQKFLTEYKAPYDIKVILSDQKLAYSQNARQAQDAATGKWILVTQNDCFFKPGSIQALINTFLWIEEKTGREVGCLGIAGGHWNSQFDELIDYSHWNGDGVVGYKQQVMFDYIEVDWLNGFLLLYRGDVARSKGIAYDTRYDPAWEDVDLGYQFNRTHGLPVIMVSMKANHIPLIHHQRNKTIPSVYPNYKKLNADMKEVFKKKWYG